MTRFFIRIELHDAPNEVYPVLHKIMAKNGFTRFTDGGRKYPDASYKGLSPRYNTAKKLSIAIGKYLSKVKGLEASILVVKYIKEEDLATYALEAKAPESKE